MKSTTIALSLTVILATACGGTEAPPLTDTPQTGALDGLTPIQQGALSAMNGTPTAGTVYLATDAGGQMMVVLGDDFVSDFHTGTVQVFLAQGAANLDDQRGANAESVSSLIGRVNENGAHRFAVPAGVDAARFSHVVIWCNTAAINFGAAQLEALDMVVEKRGPIVDADGPATAGTVSIVAVGDQQMLLLGDDFSSDFATGTVTVYLATSDANLADQRAADPNSVSPKIGSLNQGGAHTFSIPASVDTSRYDYAIIWCETAALNFGVAELR